MIEKKTHQSMMTTQDRNKLNQDLQELRDHIDIKDRKINVLHRKVRSGKKNSETNFNDDNLVPD